MANFTCGQLHLRWTNSERPNLEMSQQLRPIDVLLAEAVAAGMRGVLLYLVGATDIERDIFPSYLIS